jgi:alpha-glucosidase
MYLESRVDGNSTSSHGVFVSSSQGQDILLRDGVIEYRMLGGSLDFHEQMAFVIGRPAMPPYWSLGFHLSRWGYDNITQCREMVSKMRTANVPLEVGFWPVLTTRLVSDDVADPLHLLPSP